MIDIRVLYIAQQWLALYPTWDSQPPSDEITKTPEARRLNELWNRLPNELKRETNDYIDAERAKEMRK